MKANQLKGRYEHINRLTDDEIIVLVQQGSRQALDYLIDKYKNLVRAKSRAYFLIGADREDIIQEGMIGLYKAIRDFDRSKLSSFRSFAELCIKRQMITAIKSATRKKHTPLNSSVSLDKPIFDAESERTLLDVIEGQAAVDPQDILVKREKQGHVKLKITETLSDLERKVLRLYLEGKTYEEMSLELKRHTKSIDNALQRVKKKLEKFQDTNEVLLSFIEYEGY